jgi:hypothetical protein
VGGPRQERHRRQRSRVRRVAVEITVEDAAHRTDPTTASG